MKLSAFKKLRSNLLNNSWPNQLFVFYGLPEFKGQVIKFLLTEAKKITELNFTEKQKIELSSELFKVVIVTILRNHKLFKIDLSYVCKNIFPEMFKLAALNSHVKMEELIEEIFQWLPYKYITSILRIMQVNKFINEASLLQRKRMLNDFLNNKSLNEFILTPHDNKISKIFEILGFPITQYRDIERKNILHIICEHGDKANLLAYLIDEYPQLSHELDMHGNSLLYYAANSHTLSFVDYMSVAYRSSPQIYNLFKVFLKHKAKYIRNHEVSSSDLIFKTILGMPLELTSSKDEDLIIDQTDIENNMTALHYATLTDNTKAAKQLLDFGASYTIEDKLGHSPLYYAILYNRVDIITYLFKNLGNKEIAKILNSLYTQQVKNYKTTILTAACFSGNMDMYELLKSVIKKLSSTDQLIHEILSENEVDVPQIDFDIYPLEDVFKAVAAAAKIQPDLHSQAQEYITSNILPLLAQSQENFARGLAYGIEYEFSDVHCSAELPIDFLLPLFNAKIEQDSTVASGLINLKSACNLGEELISGIIDSPQKMQQFMHLLNILSKNGAMAGKGTGFHVHVNIRGSENLPSITSSFKSGFASTEQAELTVVKQILVNWASIEPELAKFVRRGELIDFKNLDFHYAAPIAPHLTKMLACNTLDELAGCLGDRNFAMNVASLFIDSPERSPNIDDIDWEKYSLASNGHGTLEIRMLEGITNPTIIGAWINFVHRLVTMSTEQAQHKIEAGVQGKFLPHPEIRNLIPILLAERNYPKTWNEKLQITSGSSNLYSKTDEKIYSEIGINPLYSLYRKEKAKGYKSTIQNNDVERWSNFTKHYPGIIQTDLAEISFLNHEPAHDQYSLNSKIFVPIIFLGLMLLGYMANKLSNTSPQHKDKNITKTKAKSKHRRF